MPAEVVMQDDFFKQYEQAMARSDINEIASMYAPSFFVGGPQGSMIFKNDQKFLDWLRTVDGFNKKAGMVSHRYLNLEEERRLSPAHYEARAEWGTKFQKTGDQLITYKITYLLEDLGEGPKILGYISEEDQEEKMRQLGLMPEMA